MKRLSVQLSDEEFAKISKYAEEAEQSVNSVIRQLVRRWKTEEKDL